MFHTSFGEVKSEWGESWESFSRVLESFTSISSRPGLFLNYSSIANISAVNKFSAYILVPSGDFRGKVGGILCSKRRLSLYIDLPLKEREETKSSI